MKSNTYIALIALFIFTFINLIGGLVNSSMGYGWGTNDVMEVIPLHITFCFLYWLTCIPNIKIRETLRLPIISMTFWTLIAISFLTSKPGPSHMATGDFIYDTIPAFCFFINTLGLIFISDSNLFLIGILIIGVTLYQIMVFELSKLILMKLIKKGLQQSV